MLAGTKMCTEVRIFGVKMGLFEDTFSLKGTWNSFVTAVHIFGFQKDIRLCRTDRLAGLLY